MLMVVGWGGGSLMKRVIGFILMIVGLFFLLHVVWESDVVGWLMNRSTLSKSIPVQNIKSIEVDATNLDLVVVPTDTADLKAVLTGKDTNNVRLSVDRDFDKAKINVDTKWYTFSFIPHRLKLYVYVPRSIQPNLNVELTAGNVHIGDKKDIRLNLSNLTTTLESGNSELINVKLNQWRHEATSGNVTADNVVSNEAKLDITSGNVDVKHISGNFRATLTSGNIKAQFDRLTGDIRTDLTSGNIRLDLPQKADFTLKAEQTVGQIKSSYPLQWKQQTEDMKTASYGTGKDLIQTEVLSGNLFIY